MNPKTGEVLSLVSSPSYNPNEFILGMSEDRWNELNKNENKPMYNRFKKHDYVLGLLLNQLLLVLV